MATGFPPAPEARATGKAYGFDSGRLLRAWLLAIVVTVVVLAFATSVIGYHLRSSSPLTQGIIGLTVCSVVVWVGGAWARVYEAHQTRLVVSPSGVAYRTPGCTVHTT